MAKIVKLTKDGVQIYPQSITDAIADVRTRMVLSDWMEMIESGITNLDVRIGVNENDIVSLSAIVQNYDERIDHVENDMASVLSDVSLLSGIVASDAEKIANLEIDFVALSGIVGTNTEKILEIVSEISSITSNITILSGAVSSNTDRIDSIETSVSGISDNIESLSGQVEQIDETVLDINTRLGKVEELIGSGSTTEFIDNLWELLRWFSGVTDATPFIEVIKKFVEAQDAEDIPTTEIDESSIDYPEFDDLVSGRPSRPESRENTPAEEATAEAILSAITAGNTKIIADGPIGNVTIPSTVTGMVTITGDIQDGATITNESSKALSIIGTNEEPVSVIVVNPSGSTYMSQGNYSDVYAVTKSISGSSGKYATITNFVFGEELEGAGNLSVTANWTEDAKVVSYNTNTLTVGNGTDSAALENIQILAPNATVNLNGQWGDVEAAVSNDTLILGPSFKANKLLVTKGNVLIKNAKGFDDAVGELSVPNGTAGIYTVNAVQGTSLTNTPGNYNITETMTFLSQTFGTFASGNYRYNINNDLNSTDTSRAAFLQRNTVDCEYNGSANITAAAYGLWVASEQSHATVNGGHWIADSHAIYCELGSIDIYGGEFEVTGEDSTFLINCKDANYRAGTAKITIYGGKFHGFNPANNKAEGEGTNFVANGYKSVEVSEGIWEVIPEN